MSAVVTDGGTVRAVTSLAMAPKPRLNFLTTCETQTPIAAQGSAPPVVFIVKSPAGVRNQPFVGTISPTDGNGLTLTDGKPEDHLSSADFPLPDVMLAGGSFGCSVGPGSVGNFAPLAGLAGFLVMLTGRNRRRRRAS